MPPAAPAAPAAPVVSLRPLASLSLAVTPPVVAHTASCRRGGGAPRWWSTMAKPPIVIGAHARRSLTHPSSVAAAASAGAACALPVNLRSCLRPCDHHKRSLLPRHHYERRLRHRPQWFEIRGSRVVFVNCPRKLITWLSLEECNNWTSRTGVVAFGSSYDIADAPYVLQSCSSKLPGDAPLLLC